MWLGDHDPPGRAPDPHGEVPDAGQVGGTGQRAQHVVGERVSVEQGVLGHCPHLGQVSRLMLLLLLLLLSLLLILFLFAILLKLLLLFLLLLPLLLLLRLLYLVCLHSSRCYLDLTGIIVQHLLSHFPTLIVIH